MMEYWAKIDLRKNGMMENWVKNRKKEVVLALSYYFLA
jgi:hypothetical protein